MWTKWRRLAVAAVLMSGAATTMIGDSAGAAGTVTITALQGPDPLSAAVPQAVEGQPASPSLNAAFTDTNHLAPSSLTVTVNYGDGSPVASNQSGPNFDPNLLVTQVGGAGGTTYTVTDVHTFAEESPPPLTFTITLTVTETGSPANTDTQTTRASVIDAAIGTETGGSPGPGTPFSGIGGTSASTTPGSANAALLAFETGIGGVKNTAKSEQSGGFRTVNWDGVNVGGTDFGGPPNTTVIAGHTVGIPVNRFQGQGVSLGAVQGVSNDGFVDVNPTVGAPNPVLFPAFSSPNETAPFNGNTLTFNFVAPSVETTTPMPQAVRGFGAVFLNVTQVNTTTIQFFGGPVLLDQQNVPVGGQGVAVFAGELFSHAVVTQVVITLGNATIFKFDGTTVTSAGTDGVGIGLNGQPTNLVAMDDVAFPEPGPLAGAVITPSPGISFSGPVAHFVDNDPNGNAKDFTAQINWGDGSTYAGSVSADSGGGFQVSGAHTYATNGPFLGVVHVADFGHAISDIPFAAVVGAAGTGVTLTSNHSSQPFGTPVTFTATISPSSGPTGTVSFVLDGSSSPFTTVPLSGNTASTTTSGLGAGNHAITARYNGDGTFGPSTSSGLPDTVTVTSTITGSHPGAIEVPSGQSVLITGATAGSVIVESGGAVDIENSSISSLGSNGAVAVRECGTTASGSIAIGGSTGLVQIGDSGDDQCAGNHASGQYAVQNNTGGVEIEGNHAPAFNTSGNSGSGAFLPEDASPDISGNGP